MILPKIKHPHHSKKVVLNFGTVYHNHYDDSNASILFCGDQNYSYFTFFLNSQRNFIVLELSKINNFKK
jgi:hypothetical protein